MAVSKGPKVFVAYSWEDDEHNAWVLDLAGRLRAEGIDAILDQWEVHLGDQLPQFMERAVGESDFVIFVCTPTYKERMDGRKGGVGYEGHMITAEAYAANTQRKFIPILRRGEWHHSAPSWAVGKAFLDMRGPFNPTAYSRLIASLLLRAPSPPPLGDESTRQVSTHRLPYPRDPFFIGREEELDELHQSFTEQGAVGDRAPVAAIAGIAGIGKSQLAIEYAYRYASEYRLALWIDASASVVETSFASLEPLLCPGLPTHYSISQRAESVRIAMEEGGRYLLVIDNVAEVEEYSRYLPRNASAHVILTTRRQDLPGVRTIPVAPLPPRDAIQLLSRSGPDSLDSKELEAARALCVELDGLPLALSIAGGLLRPGLLGPSIVLNRLRALGPLRALSPVPSRAVGRRPSLSVVLDEAASALQMGDACDQMAAAMLAASGGFAPAPIPLEELEVAALALRGVIQGSDRSVAASRLVDLGLARIATCVYPGGWQRNGAGALVFHRLTGAFGAERSGTSAISAAMMAISTAVKRDSKTVALLLPLSPHIKFLGARIDASASSEIDWDGLPFVPPEGRWGYVQHLASIADAIAAFGSSLPSGGLIFWNSNLPDEIYESYRVHLTFVRKEGGDDRLHLSHSAIVLVAAAIYRFRRGRYEESISAFETAIEEQEAVAEGHPYIVRILQLLASALVSVGARDRARLTYSRSLAVIARIHGPCHPWALAAQAELDRIK